MSRESLLAMASGTLERQGARLVDFSDEAVAVESGMGGGQRVDDVTLRPLLDWIADHQELERVGIASYFRGVGAAVLAPRLTRREANLGFAEAAARMMPSLEGPLYARGVGAVTGDSEALFGHDTFGGLWVSYFLEVDTGRRLITEAMVDRWSVSAERTQKAAQSLLFHRSYNVVPQAYEIRDVPGCQAFQLGDSYDATRALIFDTLLYQRALGGLLLGVPSSDLCLLMDLPEESASEIWDAFAARVGSLWKQSAWPLSSQLFTVKLGLPQPVAR